jgi:tripartite-type tricarboxylate transporter receptor subunit TctC
MKMTYLPRLLAIGFIFFIFSSNVQAQSYPNRPIKLVIGYPPGAATDLFGRAIAKQMQDSMGQAIVVDNKVGAAGTVAAESVIRSAPDGYTLLNSASQIVINPFVQKLPFNTEKDLIPLAQTITVSYVLIASPNFPVNSVADLIDYAQKNPGKINYGSYGSGSGPHLSMAMLEKAAGVKMQHVQYRGSPQLLTALMAGEIDVAFDTTTSTLALIQSGKIKPLAIGGSKPSELLPNVPPVAKSYPGFDSDGWQGIFLPANTPIELVKKLNLEVNNALKSPTLKSLAESRGVKITGGSSEQFIAIMKQDLKKYEQVIRENNIKMD